MLWALAMKQKSPGWPGAFCIYDGYFSVLNQSSTSLRTWSLA